MSSARSSSSFEATGDDAPGFGAGRGIGRPWAELPKGEPIGLFGRGAKSPVPAGFETVLKSFDLSSVLALLLSALAAELIGGVGREPNKLVAPGRGAADNAGDVNEAAGRDGADSSVSSAASSSGLVCSNSSSSAVLADDAKSEARAALAVGRDAPFDKLLPAPGPNKPPGRAGLLAPGDPELAGLSLAGVASPAGRGLNRLFGRAGLPVDVSAGLSVGELIKLSALDCPVQPFSPSDLLPDSVETDSGRDPRILPG